MDGLCRRNETMTCQTWKISASDEQLGNARTGYAELLPDRADRTGNRQAAAPDPPRARSRAAASALRRSSFLRRQIQAGSACH